jgi:hypothetical protein
VRRRLEQVFLRRRAGRIEALAVLERESGARERHTVPLPSTELEAAARLLGRELGRSGRADSVRGVRVRVERGGSLVDEPGLAQVLERAFEVVRRSDPGTS